jgi:hypothetical protein
MICENTKPLVVAGKPVVAKFGQEHASSDGTVSGLRSVFGSDRALIGA